MIPQWDAEKPIYLQLYQQVIDRIVQGDFVMDHELITGRDNDVTLVAIYEVKDGLITRAWFVR